VVSPVAEDPEPMARQEIAMFARILPVACLLMLVAPMLRTSHAAPPPAEPVQSALVTVAGPSVYRQFVALGGPARSAEETRARAKRLAGPLQAAKAAVGRSQAPVVAAAERLGVAVVSRYHTAANGLLVHATARQLAALRRVPGVVAVEPAPIVRPELAMSVPFIGADALARLRGYDGSGSVVAIIDTGVDYTHAMLGGPGTPESYTAAAAAQEVISDTYDGELLFPNDKVVGGWDFVGPKYNTPALCPPPMQAAGTCSPIPNPDPDPLDAGFHGTHVAGIAAGEDAGSLHHGVAPGAQVVALKLYGSMGGDEAADVLVDAIEWCAGVNLGTEERGVRPDHIDSINISLGEVEAQGSRLFDEAAAAAVGSGIVIAASAGNSGNRPYVLGTPSASPKILSVASSLAPAKVLMVNARWDGGQADYPAIEGTSTKPLADIGLITSELAWFGRACPDDAPIQDVAEKVALIERGVCTFPEKILKAQQAGAIAILMFTDARPKTAMGGDGTGIEIPGAMIDNQPGLDLKARLEGGTVVTVTLDPERTSIDHTAADSISGFSSRGPSKNGALKPDITAPGSNIISASYTTGGGGTTASGTSMSSPHIAGVGAVMQQRNREEQLGLTGAEVAALIMNYAQPAIFEGTGAAKATVPLTRQGAGRVNMVSSGTGELVARAGDIASINLGPVSLLTPWQAGHEIVYRNLTTEPMSITLDARYLFPEDEGQGLTIGLPSGAVRIPAEGMTTVPVTFDVDPANVRTWNLRGRPLANVGAFDQLEIDGHITAKVLDPSGRPLPDLPAPSIPFYTLPRRASAVGVRVHPGDRPLTFANDSAYDGDVELFMVPEGDQGEDSDEPDVRYELDVRQVGVRFERPTATVTQTMVTFGLALHEPAAIPTVTRAEVYIDADRDGTIDYRVRTGAGPDGYSVAVGRWDSTTGAVSGDERLIGSLATDLHTRVSWLTVPISAIGQADPAPFDFYVINRGLNEDWLDMPTTDVVPDGADQAGGQRYTADPEPAMEPERWSLAVSGNGTAEVPVMDVHDKPTRSLVAFYPDNRFEPADGQMARIPRGAEAVPTIFLPLSLKDYEWGQGSD
jgi:subtilisin family serine protease